MASVSEPIARRRADPRLQAALIFGASLLAAIALFAPAWHSMGLIWWHNETYAHGMLMPVVSAWLVWRNRASLRGLAVRPAPTALAAVAACAVAWTLGQIAGVNTLVHFAAVGMVPALLGLCFGWAVLTRLALPLSFLLFAVPFGDFLLPWLMDRTADFTVSALVLSGIPVLREGRNFVLPTGHWSVIEACSGLRYLLAAIPLGLLYAHLHFRSAGTRTVYVGLVVLIALLANWLRAYLIVMLGHLSDMRLAAGVDHLIYGWLFFGLVMGIAFWAGARLPDRGPLDGAAAGPALPSASTLNLSTHRTALVPAAFALLMLGAAPHVAARLQQAGTAQIRMQVLREALVPATGLEQAFLPGYEARDAAIGRLRGEDRTGIAVFRYFRQHREGELVAHRNAVLPRGSTQDSWRLASRTSPAPARWPGRSAEDRAATEYEIEGAGRRWIAWEWLWVDGRVYASQAAVKLATARALLAGRGDESAAMVLWTAVGEAPGDSPQQARQRLTDQVDRLRPLARAAGL